MNTHVHSSQVVIRPASFNDIPLIQEIAYSTWPKAYGMLLGKDQVDYMLEKFYSSQALEAQLLDNHRFFLALRDYKPVGFASFSAVSSTVCKLQKLYVLPLQQKTGTGKALLNTVEAVAKSLGADTLLLNVNRKNTALSFYNRNGFTVIAEEDIDIDNGYFMNDYSMQKKLQ